MLLAVIMHARRKESVTVELILCVLAIATAIVGFLAI
jgi:hypothetical protein